MSVVVSNVTLPFLNDVLALRVYTCAEEEVYRWPAPVIVLCHGFAGVQEMLLPAVARALALEGFVVVTFDYRGFGDSGGEPGRQTENSGRNEDNDDDNNRLVDGLDTGRSFAGRGACTASAGIIPVGKHGSGVRGKRRAGELQHQEHL
ncbi:TPA: alpha/beta fold hydrolase [Serratia marcescens]|uniref:alpha/beta fold hydrolase n=1 Tax=Serratia TaxID=613 RepID=UPI0013DC3328|nr:alpha/beta fold hydrolase [Serratia marcescens]MBH3286786.1 alpha/beta fold hydrolase [Serratia marcescens]MBN5435283.1 alpha/beta fold hydrolase [Serratia marcescens]HAT3795359.1 alpha/beta hydrolase [Serratia marcescens]HEI9729374.1 alpha/beta fold hydrolase [Serratia marcescens]